MNYYLVVYNRRTGEVTVRDFGPAERDAAFRARFEVEASVSDDDIEVVVLGGKSREDLARTHGRYFASVAQLARDAASRGWGRGKPGVYERPAHA